MVFPIGAHVWELAADHLDRLPRKSLLEGLVHDGCVAKNDHAAGANEPHDGAEGRGDQANGDGNDIKTGVQLRGGEAGLADLEVLAVELADEEHAEDDEDDVKEEPGVGKQGIDAEHGKDHGIVAGEVAEIVVDTRLGFGKVLGLRQPLEVEELGNGPEVGESAGQGGGSYAVEPVSQLEAAGQGVNGYLDARHVGFGLMCFATVVDVAVALGQSGQQWVDLGDKGRFGGRGPLLAQSKGVEGEARSRGLCLSTSDGVDGLESTKERRRGKLRRECGSLEDLTEVNE